MTDEERYLFDLNGYLLIRDCVPAEIVAKSLCTADELEGYIAKTIDMRPRSIGHFNISYRYDADYGFCSYKMTSGGLQYVVDDIESYFPRLRSAQRACPLYLA